MAQLFLFIPDRDDLDAHNTRCDWIVDGIAATAQREAAAPLAALASHARGKRVVLVLPASRVFACRASLPAGGAARRTATVARYAIEDQLALDADLVHAVAGSAEADGRSLVVAVDRAWFTQALEACRSVGIAPASAIALPQLIALNSGIWRVITTQGSPVCVRDDGTWFALDTPSDGGPGIALTQALAQAHVRRVVPRELFIHAASADRQVAQSWRDVLGVPVTPHNAWQPAFERAPAAIDLLAHEFARPAFDVNWHAWRAAAVIAALIALTHVLATVWDAARLKREKTSLQTEMVALFKSTFPETQAVVDPSLQMQRKREELERATGREAQSALAAELARIASATEDDSARLTAIRYDGTTLEVDVTTDSARFATLKQRLQTLVDANVVSDSANVLTIKRKVRA